MRSLRFVLAGWMVTLLGAVLLVIGILAYRTSGELLIERQQAARELEQIRMDERLKEQRERLDRELLDQAQTLARLMQFQLDWGKFRHRELHILGLFFYRFGRQSVCHVSRLAGTTGPQPSGNGIF